MNVNHIVILSTADWDNPFWTNKQHVACELARIGHKVFYIDSLGLRRPSASAQDMKRIWGRLKKAIRPPQQVRDSLWVWSPIVIPFQRYKFVQFLNRFLLNAGLKFWLWKLSFKNSWFWTYNPMTTRFFNLRDYKKTVYHCVDEIKAQPGMPVEEIEAAETELMREVGVCFVTAEHLLETRRQLNPKTHYFSNVADYAHFSKTRDEVTTIPDDMAGFKKPVIGFVGAISGYKVNFDLLKQMSEKHPEWSIVMIGKVGEGDPWTDVSLLKDNKNIHFIGPRDYKTLPNYLKSFDVAILPNMLNEYTKSMFPMKFFEYLAAGLPVVATQLHAIREYTHVAAICASNEEFVQAIENALAGKVASLESRLEVAKEKTYERRTARMLEIIGQ